MSAQDPFSRPYAVGRIPQEGVTVEVAAEEAERAALARLLDIPAIHTLTGRFRLTGQTRRVSVKGRVQAEIEQTCVVTLEPFSTSIDEEVDVSYEEPSGREPERGEAETEVEADLDRPDEIVGGKIDLGTLTAEFLAIGLDPYPRKPGIAFEAPQDEPDDGAEAAASPFASLSALRGKGDGTS